MVASGAGGSWSAVAYQRRERRTGTDREVRDALRHWRLGDPCAESTRRNVRRHSRARRDRRSRPARGAARACAGRAVRPARRLHRRRLRPLRPAAGPRRRAPCTFTSASTASRRTNASGSRTAELQRSYRRRQTDLAQGEDGVLAPCSGTGGLARPGIGVAGEVGIALGVEIAPVIGAALDVVGEPGHGRLSDGGQRGPAAAHHAHVARGETVDERREAAFETRPRRLPALRVGLACAPPWSGA